MKFTVLLLAAILPLGAANITELSLDAGGGIKADLLVDSIGAVACSGTCGGLQFASTISPHGTLNVTGTIGQFTITTVTAVGRLAIASPGVLNLTQNEATSTGAGTLTVLFSDTGYTSFANTFQLAATADPDSGITASTVNGQALVDAANTLGGGVAFDSFSLSGVDLYTHSSLNVVPSGSLTAITQLNFSGAGHLQTALTLSNLGPTVHGTVPEPQTFALAGGALLTLLGIRKRRRA